MTVLAIAKLVIDGILLLSLGFLAFKVIGKQQPSTIANLAKLKELEVSLKEIVRDADDAGRSLSDDLLGRKRDLEKILTEVEGAENRINKSKNTTIEAIELAKEAEQSLEKLLKKTLVLLESEEQAINQTPLSSTQPANRKTQKDNYSNSSNIEQLELLTRASKQYETSRGFDYNQIPEPASFSKPSRQLNNSQQANLRQQIEVDYSYKAAPVTAEPIHTSTEDFIPDSQPQQNILELRKDPRLGVLGAINREPGIY